ncbi:hypothetical protein C2S52_017885 [Perilla frutescens var. hirtella]|nr:hypothetical protein C2S52_017885 [Perilla frutescens var. hirtella]KAH6811645.1 hypothetical protein C2S51_025407 [Perilla frutescens var. frutescens]
MGNAVARRGFCRLGGAGGCRNSGGRMMSSISKRVSPWLMLPPSLDDTGNVEYKFHRLGSKIEEVYKKKDSGGGGFPLNGHGIQVAGSSHGWLALYNQVNHDVFLVNPITSRHIKLPPVKGVVSRFSLSCSPDDGDCRAMISVGPTSRLIFCVPGRSTEWTPIGDLYCDRWNYRTQSSDTVMREYEDVVYSSRHKLFFCITRFKTELEGWNVADPLSPTMDWRVPHNEELTFDRLDYPWPAECQSESDLKDQCWHLKYLVLDEQSDELFLVVRHVNPRMRRDGSFAEDIYYSKFRGCDYSYPYKTVDFDVYKIDRHEGGKVKLRHMETSLNGLAMFVGINQSCALSASEFPELKPNSIYFTDEKRLMLLSKSPVHNRFGGHDNGIFDFQNNTFSSCCGRCPLVDSLDYGCIKRIDPPPLWFTPPPNTLKASLKKLEVLKASLSLRKLQDFLKSLKKLESLKASLTELGALRASL